MIERASTTREPLLIGRQREPALLWRHFESATAGHMRVVLVSGEPGIGKTRLLDVIAAHATQKGALVLHGGASESEGIPSYLPFLEAFGQHIRAAVADELREQTGVMASVLATILPELPASYPLPPEQARLRLYEAVGMFLAAIAIPRPLLLIWYSLG